MKAEEALKQYSDNVLGIVSDVRSLESEAEAVKIPLKNLVGWIM